MRESRVPRRRRWLRASGFKVFLLAALGKCGVAVGGCRFREACDLGLDSALWVYFYIRDTYLLNSHVLRQTLLYLFKPLCESPSPARWLSAPCTDPPQSAAAS